MSQPNAPPDWVDTAFASRLFPLVRTAAGPVVWRVEDAVSNATISEQFRAGAGDYHARYAASDHFEGLFRQAIAATRLRLPEAPDILDLGSGSGANSVAPCLRLFPDARIVATDLSGELLAILADDLPRLGAAERVACVVMDAMGDHVAGRSFDLVTGAAILHHLDRPELALRAAARALKPGGAAIFFEPFDGYALVRLAYQRILAEAEGRRPGLDPEIAQALQAMVTDVAARTAADRAAHDYAAMDDKWLFAPEEIAGLARSYGFTKAEFVPQNDHPTLYRDTALVQIRLHSGRDDAELPDWALSIVDEFDAAMPLQAKRRMMLEGAMVLTRAAAVGSVWAGAAQ